MVWLCMLLIALRGTRAAFYRAQPPSQLAVSFHGWTPAATTCRRAASSSPFSQTLEPLVICGPSGAGKGTLINKFMNERGGKSKFSFVTSHTTRQPRPGEVDGEHYHFVSIETMKAAIDEGGFLEHAEVHGNFYGTSWQAVQDVHQEGFTPLLDIDVQGVKSLKAIESDDWKPVYVFIAPPSLEVLKARLRGRGTESDESMQKRTKNAKAELEYGTEDGNFDCVVINDDLEMACEELEMITDALY